MKIPCWEAVTQAGEKDEAVVERLLGVGTPTPRPEGLEVAGSGEGWASLYWLVKVSR